MTDIADSGAAPADAAPASDGLGGDVGTAVAQAGSAAEALDAAITQATPGVADAGQPNDSASASVLDGDLADGDAFGRSYVESIRNEGRSYREQLREAQAANEQWDPYRQSLERYQDADRQVWLNLMDGWLTDPRQAAEMMQQIATGVLGEGDDGVPADPDAIDAAAAQTGLTAEQVSKIVTDQIAAREAQVKQQAEVDKVFSSIRDAGYDPQTAEGFSILWRANNETNGDIDAAIEAHEASRQQVIDNYVSGRAAGAPAVAVAA